MSTSDNDKPIGWVIGVTLPRPSLANNTADADRLCLAVQQELKTVSVDLDLTLARKLPPRLKHGGYVMKCLVVQNRKSVTILQAQPAQHPCAFIGLAVDLGTTRVVLRLVDLSSGSILSETAFDNPQIAVGSDILTRVHHADRPGGAQELQRCLVDCLNDRIRTLCVSSALQLEDIYLISVAGNTTMSHLLTGLPVNGVIREPYIPAVNRFGIIPARDLGLRVHDRARVLIFPCVGSYLGGDIIAGILYAGLTTHKEPSLLVDVGTNAEVVLGNNEWLMACAGAAGPALEGGVSHIGTMAKPGVIDRVSIDPESRIFKYHTIDDLPAKGICGSGFIDLAAALFRAGMIDIRGKFHKKNCGGRLVEKDDQACLVVIPGANSAGGEDLCISQADMDSLIRSKAAMFTILETITTTMGLALEQIGTFFVAGTFGSFIDPRSAITIGMLPDLPIRNYKRLGNSSLGGATMALTERRHWAAVDQIRDRVTYLELNVNQDFMNRYSAAKFLPHTDPGRFASVPRPAS